MRRVALAVFATIAGLIGLLSFKTHSASVANPNAAISTTGPGDAAAPNPSSSSGSPSSAPSGSNGSPSSGSAASSTKTVTGDAIDTRWGPVQVKITVASGKLTDVTPVVYPTENPRDQQINAYAIPELTKEALAAGNAKIDMISGATYTSEGYIGSLQSALDKAGLS
jgi:uncharacterized protein with FMN-binding domain